MRPRHTGVLKDMGCEASVEEFRSALAEIKAEHFPQFTDEELTYTRDEAGTFCSLVRKRLGAPCLSRPFILRSLIGLRKKKRAAGTAEQAAG